jgi:hypothetical protein
VSDLERGELLAFVEMILNLSVKKQWPYSKEQLATAGRRQCAFSFVRHFNHLAIMLGDAMCPV